MSGLCKGKNLNSLQQKRFMALDGYVFGALQVSQSDVGSFEKMVDLVNLVYEADIVFRGNTVAAIDEMWGYVSALSKAQRKKLRTKNLTKVPYPMKGAVGARQRAKLQNEYFHSEKAARIRKQADIALLAAVKKTRVTRNKAVTVKSKDEFYKSWEWRTLRMEAIKEFGRACQCCGATPGMRDAAGQPVRICVDHIKPISKFWHLRLDRSNLQILCDECNQGKGNWDETDFRQPDEWAEAPFEDVVLDVLAEMAPANEVAA